MQPRLYQSEATDALMNALGRDVHPIVVAPTGSGKSLMICDFVDKFLTKYSESNILILSHVKEILRQDHDALSEYFDGYDIGLYSAGMQSRTIGRITVAGIQSIYDKHELFKDFHIVIIDECHLVTIKQTGMYRIFLSNIKANYVGFTATHFRLGHGYIHKGQGALFNCIAYDMSKPDIFNKLVTDGYLTRLITKATLMKMNVDDIKIRAKDYAINELSKKFDRNSVTQVAIDEIIQFGEKYKKWLIFAIDIEHAEHVTQALIDKGITAAVVHSKMDADRDLVVADFKRGKYRAVVNVDILTTGLDVPDIDLIAMLRPTKSPVVHVQSIGRGLRVATGKDHCLVLDFAGNTARLGPINDVIINQRSNGPGGGEAIVKECPDCQALIPAASKLCDVCGHKFVFITKLEMTASTKEIVRSNITEWCDVVDIKYSVHTKPGKAPSLKVSYRIGIQTINEWVCYDHKGYPKYKADNWVRHRSPSGMPMPKDVYELYQWANWLKQPIKLLVNLSDKFPQVKDAKFA